MTTVWDKPQKLGPQTLTNSPTLALVCHGSEAEVQASNKGQREGMRLRMAEMEERKNRGSLGVGKWGDEGLVIQKKGENYCSCDSPTLPVTKLLSVTASGQTERRKQQGAQTEKRCRSEVRKTKEMRSWRKGGAQGR